MQQNNSNSEDKYGRIKLRDEPEKRMLGRNLHVLKGHERIDFIKTFTKKGGTVLDIGCGEGAFSIYAHNELECKVTAVDLLPVGPPLTQYHDIKILQCDIYSLSFKNEFDTVYLMEVIEHLGDEELALDVAFKAVAPGGKLLITTPHVPDWDKEPDHLWRFTRRWANHVAGQFKESKVFFDEIFIYLVLPKLSTDSDLDWMDNFDDRRNVSRINTIHTVSRKE